MPSVWLLEVKLRGHSCTYFFMNLNLLFSGVNAQRCDFCVEQLNCVQLR